MRNLGYFLLGVVIAAVLVVATSWDWLTQPLPVSVEAQLEAL